MTVAILECSYWGMQAKTVIAWDLEVTKIISYFYSSSRQNSPVAWVLSFLAAKTFTLTIIENILITPAAQSALE
jgi:hypothetical protein